MSKYLYKTYFKDNLTYPQVRCFFPNMSLPATEDRVTEALLAELYASPLRVERYERPVPPAPTPEEELAAAKTRKKSELTNRRDQEEYLNITTSKGTFEFDQLSRTRLQDAMAAMTETDTRQWTTADGTIVEVMLKDIQDIFAAANVRSDINYAKLQRLKEAVEAATSIEEVNAIQWDESAEVE